MILQVSLIFIVTFIAGYFAGGFLNKRKKKKKNPPEQDTTKTTFRSVRKTDKKETLN